MGGEIELEVLKSVVAKLDLTLDKISESTNSISRLLAVHDERICNLEKNDSERGHDVRDIYSKMEKNTKEILKEIGHVEGRIDEKLVRYSDQSNAQFITLTQKVEHLDNRINEVEKWKWYVVGSVGVVIFILSNISQLNDLVELIKK